MLAILFATPMLAAPVDHFAVSSRDADGPPPGPKNLAFCPVTGQNLTLTSDTPSLTFTNGQQIYFASGADAGKYRASPRDYWLAPHDMPLPGIDGMRGLPDLRGETRYCPRSNETIVIAMQTPRVVHRHGQAVYFCCFGCVTAFWREPSMYFEPAAISLSEQL